MSEKPMTIDFQSNLICRLGDHQSCVQMEQYCSHPNEVTPIITDHPKSTTNLSFYLDNEVSSNLCSLCYLSGHPVHTLIYTLEW